MEVKLELVPVGPTRREAEARRLNLTELRKTCEVGRASSNPYKTGLAPTKSNAMIDSPIMSRQHARFTLVINPVGVELQDLGSTHGTFVEGGRKLQPHSAYRVHSGEQVTFGTKVTNGSDEHEAKTFRVFHNAKEAETFPLPPRPCSRPISVLESDESDSESESIVAGEEALREIVHNRGFTVPTTSDDEDYESEAEGEDDDLFHKGNETSNVTTPEKAEEAVKSGRKTVNLESILNDDDEAQPGSSQHNPIELEPRVARFELEETDVLDEDEEDDLGEHVEDRDMMELLLDREAEQDLADERPAHQASRVPSPPPRPLHPLSAILNEPTESFREQSQVEPQMVIPETQLRPIGECLQHDISHTGLSESESEESESESEFAPDEVPEITFSSIPPAPERDVAADLSVNDRSVRAVSGLSVDGHPLRAPSPSDAALAKSKQTYTPSNTFFDNLPPLPYSEKFDAYQPYSHAPGGYWGLSAAEPPQPEPIYSTPRLYNPYDSLYDRSANTYDDLERADRAGWPGPSTSAASNAGSTKTPEPQSDARDKASEPAYHDASRLHIANLINDTHKATEMPETSYQCSNKRKADSMSRDPEHVVTWSGTKDATHEFKPVADLRSRMGREEVECYGLGQFQSPRTPLRSTARGDASGTPQRMPNPWSEEPASRPARQVTQNETAQSQEAAMLDVTSGVSTTSAIEAPSTVQKDVTNNATTSAGHQRPSKRRRIAGGLAKFVGTAAVGALGAVAALIAFAPPDVEQEAWKEMFPY